MIESPAKWYSSSRWQKMRLFHLKQHPLCVLCEARGIVMEANHVDHVIPHHGNYQMFWFGKLQSLCEPCHHGDKAKLEHKGYIDTIGVDGWPVDANHPANKAR